MRPVTNPMHGTLCTLHNSKRDAQALCAAAHVLLSIYMSHTFYLAFSIGVSLYKWPIHYTGRTCSTIDVK